MRRLFSFVIAAVLVAAFGFAGHSTVHPTQAHAWNTYNSACTDPVITLRTGGTTRICFDLSASWQGSYWSYRESCWSDDGQSQMQCHFQLRDWICNSYDPPDYNYTSGVGQWHAISEGVVTSCGPQIDSGNSYAFGGDLAATRWVGTFSVWN